MELRQISGFLASLILIPCLVIAQVKDYPPAVERSYKAMGELVAKIPDGDGAVVQVAFEEHFNVATGDGIYTIWEMGQNMSFVETGNLTLRYIGNEDCSVINKTDWVEFDAPPSILGYSGSDSKIRFSLRQLFDIDIKYLTEKGVQTTFRDIPALMWTYVMTKETDTETITIEVDAYWADGTFETTSMEKEVPLGYRIERFVKEKNAKERITEVSQIVSVFAFLHDVVDQKAFRPREGIVCAGRTPGNSLFDTVRFPKVDAFSIRSEFILPQYQQVKTTEIWYDIKNKMLRVDLDRLTEEDPTEPRSRSYTSQITSKDLGATFRLRITKGSMECTAYAIEDHPFDEQEIVNPKLDAKLWSLDYFVGINTTQYIYLGKTEKRDIPCHLIQGVRQDWPEKSAGVKSLWEWCIAMKVDIKEDEPVFNGDDLALISAQVNISETANHSDYEQGMQMIHHFYGAVKENTDSLAVSVFDVSRCMQGNQRKSLKFSVGVKIDDQNLATIENATSDVRFLKQWQDQILSAATFTPKSMQVSRLQTTVFEKKLYVKFLILDVHEGLPKEIRDKQTSLEQGYKALKAAVDSGKVGIKYIPSKGELIEMNAVKNSLVEVVPPDFEFTTTTSTGPTPTDNTRLTPSGSTDGDNTPITSETKPPGKDTTSSVVSPITPSVKPNIDKKLVGHDKGTVAGVSIVMLLMGVTIGSAGTFYWYRRPSNRFR